VRTVYRKYRPCGVNDNNLQATNTAESRFISDFR
jgi:hypothetical protein